MNKEKEKEMCVLAPNDSEHRSFVKRIIRYHYEKENRKKKAKAELNRLMKECKDTGIKHELDSELKQLRENLKK